MRKAFVALLLAGFAAGAGAAYAGDLDQTPAMYRPVHALGAKSFHTETAAGATTWVGHKLDGVANPNTDWLDVFSGGVWDFDTDIAGTDSTQGFRRMFIPYASGLAFTISPSTDRPIQLALDHGNVINEGNTNLWNARGANKFRKTGIAGAWHSDPLGIGSPAVNALNGARSAWCGLRAPGDVTVSDALTGNAINSDHVMLASTTTVINTFPGYGNGWDQLMYKDFVADGSGGGSVTFNYRTELNTYVDTVLIDLPPPTLFDGAGWFNPNPTDLANFVPYPADSFMVYVGPPTEVAYDTNRRWLDEIINMNGHYQEIFAQSGTNASVGQVANFSGFGAGAAVRVVFRVKTNRVRSDSGTTGAFNTQAGAAIIDQVQVNGGTTYGFEAAGDITARSLAGNIALSGTPWVTTGKPPSMFFHVHNVGTLIYEDLCGQVGNPGRICDLKGNVLAIGNHDAANHVITTEASEVVEWPTINLANRVGGPGGAGTNAQGITQTQASQPGVIVDFDIYTGQMDLDQGCFWRAGIRAYKPTFYKQALTGEPKWSEVILPGSITYNPDKQCLPDPRNLNAQVTGGPGQVDSLRAVMQVISLAYLYALPGSEGNTRGTYFDRVRVGLTQANPISGFIWHQYQDQFPISEAVTPADNDLFDVLTANIRSGLNIASNGNPQSVVSGDSLIFNAAYGTGNGATTGVRLDFIFRIDPGPANYSVKGNRASALNANAFWTSYQGRNGKYGKNSAGSADASHGAFWDRNAWNSARMDSAEVNQYPINNGGQKDGQGWQTTYHESEFDAAYAAQDADAGGRNTLAISRNVCFLVPVQPSGVPTCDGSAGALYPGVPLTTTEFTTILPANLFTPGTHIEYFVRRTLLENGASVAMLFDTAEVFPHEPASSGGADFDANRFQSADVLPDMWKSGRYGGAGLACMLIVDGQDRRAAERAFIGAADSMGYGKNNGAKTGWKAQGASYTNPNDPSGFVAANNGQAGLNFDLYETRASESAEAGHLGVRNADNATWAAADHSGPSQDMLDNLYSTVVYVGGDLSSATLADNDDSEGGNDVQILRNFMDAGVLASPKGVWINGDGIVEDGQITTGADPLDAFLSARMGVGALGSGDYRTYVGGNASPALTGLIPVAGWFSPAGLVLGNANLCTVFEDVLVPAGNGTVAMNYEAIGPGPQGFVASVYRDVAGTPRYRTLVDGFDLSNVRGRYASLAQLQGGTVPGTDLGRHKWFDEVVTHHFQICARRGAVIGIGDLPGTDGSRFANLNLGAFPNPAFANSRVNLRFTLAKAQSITVRIYNVAGREVRNFTAKGLEGPNTILWDGSLSSGVKATPGVYFYRVDGIDFGAGSAPSKVIFLSQAE